MVTMILSKSYKMTLMAAGVIRGLMTLCVSFLLMGVGGFLNIPTASALTSPWVEAYGGKFRLVSTGETTPDGAKLAGLEFDLEPGWKTYWRYPGEAGIPPKLDFSGSTGLRDLEVLYPAPKRFHDGYSDSIVYNDHVILPIKIWPESDRAVVNLDLSLFVGFCEQVCVPVDGSVQLVIPAAAIRNRAVIEAVELAMNDLPTKADVASLFVESLTPVVHSEHPYADVVVSAQDQIKSIDLFAEGPGTQYIPVPKLVAINGGKATFRLDLGRLQEGPAQIRLTIVNGDTAIEREITIDATN